MRQSVPAERLAWTGSQPTPSLGQSLTADWQQGLSANVCAIRARTINVDDRRGDTVFVAKIMDSTSARIFWNAVVIDNDKPA